MKSCAPGRACAASTARTLELLLDDQPAKVYASQGQQRSVVLSLKMAEAAAAAQITGEHPVLLLDDVLSELDEGRKQYLLTRMKEKQTFVTSCDAAAFARTDGKLVFVYRKWTEGLRGMLFPFFKKGNRKKLLIIFIIIEN